MAEFMSRQLLMPPKKCGVTKSSSSVNKSGIIRRVKEEGESRGRKGAHVKRPAYEEHDYAFGQAMQTLRWPKAESRSPYEDLCVTALPSFLPSFLPSEVTCSHC
jgi:hypothetical protein